MEKQKTRITPPEREILGFIEGMTRAFKTYGGRLKRLCERIDAAEDVDTIINLTDKMLIGLADTIPDDQIMSVVNQMRQTEVHIGLKKPTGRPKDYWVMSYEDTAVLADYATRTECIACDGKKHKCPLRDVLKDLPVMGITDYYVACWKEEE